LRRTAARPSLLDAVALSDACWEKLHTGDWRDVPACWRDAFSAAALCHYALASPQQLRQLDLAVLVGGDLLRDDVLAARSSLLPAPSLDDDEQEEDGRDSKRHKAASTELGRPPSGAPVPLPPGHGVGGVARAELPSLEAFARDCLLAAQPCVLTGVLDSWPALQRWRDARYLLRLAGERTVPVEMGEHYLHAGWRQELMPLGRFLQEHILGKARSGEAERGYLAQHPLFSQIPALRADIATPDYCSLLGGSVELNAWLGPAGTVTPLHHDPLPNLLCQVVGAKHVRLYAPSESKRLYPHAAGLCTNSSQVDVCAPDAAAFPLFADAAFVDCVLGPGEALFIPPRWWHHVIALTSSFSVSFWWGEAQAEEVDDAPQRTKNPK